MSVFQFVCSNQNWFGNLEMAQTGVNVCSGYFSLGSLYYLLDSDLMSLNEQIEPGSFLRGALEAVMVLEAAAARKILMLHSSCKTYYDS